MIQTRQAKRRGGGLGSSTIVKKLDRQKTQCSKHLVSREKVSERWGAGVETPKNVRGEIDRKHNVQSIHIYTYICIHIHIHIYTHSLTCTHAHAHAHNHTHTHTQFSLSHKPLSPCHMSTRKIVGTHIQRTYSAHTHVQIRYYVTGFLRAPKK